MPLPVDGVRGESAEWCAGVVLRVPQGQGQI